MNKRQLTKEDIDFLKELQTERNTQDTCGLKDVRTWVIKDRDDVNVSEYGDYDYLIFFDGDACEPLSLEEIYDLMVEDNESYTHDETKFSNLRFENNEIHFDYFMEDDVVIKETDKTCIVIDSLSCHDDIITAIASLDKNISVDYMQIGWSHYFTFLTQKAAENYLKQYGHKHSDHAHPYCICTYRDPEIKRLMNIIETIDWDKIQIII